jgi:DNA polymerase elongation subunit (family B)
MSYSNDLIFGKDKTENVVSVEVQNGTLTIFKEKAGRISTEEKAAPYYVITEKKVDERQTFLPGGQEYKWLAEFDLEEDYLDAVKQLYKSRQDFWRVYDYKEMNLIRRGITYFKGMKMGDVSILSFDIETTGVKKNEDSEVLLISNTVRRSGKTIRKLFSLEDYDTQGAMIDDWCLWVREQDASILCGHNIFGFDLPYLAHVAQMHNTDLYIGRDGSAVRFNERASSFRKDGSQTYEYHNAHIYGRELIDTFFLAIKYDIGRKYSSYALKSIVREEGLEKSGRAFVDASKMKEYYLERGEAWRLAKQYAEDDSDDSLKLFDLMAPAFFYLAQSIPKTFQQINNSATGSQLNAFMVRSYLQNSESIPKATELNMKVEGGISFAVPGLYKNLVKLDLKSAYPSQVLRFKLFDQRKDPRGHFYEMVKYFTYERFELKEEYKKTKDTYFKDREQASKVVINSAYGLCNTPGLNFNAPRIAAKITKETRELINMSLTWASGKDVNYWMTLFEERTA